jgi:predicted peroxiredoxin
MEGEIYFMLDGSYYITKSEFEEGKLKSSFRKFYSRHHDLDGRYGISVSQMTTDMFILS